MLKKDFYSFAIQILGFCVLVASFFKYYSERTGIEFSKHLNSNVKMYRDSNGVPNILAENVEDAYFALGFSHAEDRLWAMYFSQKVALGEVSELFGEQALVIDRFARVLNFREVCQSAVSFLSQSELSLFQSYVNGINHYIDTTLVLPLEFLLFNIRSNDIKWDVSSSCLAGKLIEYYLTFDFFQEMMRTYLLEHLNVSKDVIEKIFPFKFEEFEYQRTIIKENEMKDFKYETIVKTMADVQYATVDEKGNIVKISKPQEQVLSSALKSEESLDSLDSDDADQDNFELRNTLRKEKGMGSNNFVISGKHTENGHPYLCNDPHLQNGMPSFWYFANMKITDKNNQVKYHMTGATSPGIPLIFIGSNSHLAWGITNGLVDTADILRIEKSNVSKDLKFLLPDNNDNNSKGFITRIETFYLDTKKTRPIQFTFLDSEFGPVINGHADSLGAALGVHTSNKVLNEAKYYYILRSTFSDKIDKNLKGMINLSLSTDISSLKKNLSYLSISLNLVFIDNKDNIGYQLTGKIPKKYSKEEGAYVKTIKLISDFHTELIPFDELPHLLNPERGYIVTSNNIVIGPDYKHTLQGGYIMDARARALEDEIVERIKTGAKINGDFINKNMLRNVKDHYCKDIIKMLKTIFKNENVDFKKSLGISDLLQFDCVMNGDSYSALIYNVFENELHHILHYHDTNLDLQLRQKAFVNLIEADERSNYLIYKLKKYSNSSLLCNEEYKSTCSELLTKAFENAISTIKLRLGEDTSNWIWENLNVKHYPHKPFSMIPVLNLFAHRMVKTDGNMRTVKVSIPRYYDKNFKSLVSSNLKYYINLSNVDKETYFSIDSGQNGRIFHRHYDDMLNNHEKGNLINFDPKFYNEKVTLEFQKLDK